MPTRNVWRCDLFRSDDRGLDGMEWRLRVYPSASASSWSASVSVRARVPKSRATDASADHQRANVCMRSRSWEQPSADKRGDARQVRPAISGAYRVSPISRSQSLVPCRCTRCEDVAGPYANHMLRHGRAHGRADAKDAHAGLCVASINGRGKRVVSFAFLVTTSELYSTWQVSHSVLLGWGWWWLHLLLFEFKLSVLPFSHTLHNECSKSRSRPQKP